MPPFSFDDNTVDWNNPNKTKAQRAILSYRGKLLNRRMGYDLDLKIRMAIRRIDEVVSRYGPDRCYISFSGGRDSTILSHLSLKAGYKLEHVYSNTRLEYPDCIKFAHDWCRKKKVKLTMVMPDVRPAEIWKKYGYPMFSKEVADLLERVRNKQYVNDKKMEKVKAYMKYKNVKLSAKCCHYLKKKPLKKWQKKSGKNVAIMGMRAEESMMRRVVWVRKGCIYVTKNQVVCNPIIIFTHEDIKKYAKKYRIRFADIYYKGFERNGCYACGFGCHLENGDNNFTNLKKLNPQLWKSVMDKWGYRKICKQCDIKVE